jgi:hypothetical protein
LPSKSSNSGFSSFGTILLYYDRIENPEMSGAETMTTET